MRLKQEKASHAPGQGNPFPCVLAQKLSLFLFHLNVDSPGAVKLCLQATDRGLLGAQVSLQPAPALFRGKVLSDESAPYLPLQGPGALRILFEEYVKILPRLGEVTLRVLYIGVYNPQVKK